TPEARKFFIEEFLRLQRILTELEKAGSEVGPIAVSGETGKALSHPSFPTGEGNFRPGGEKRRQPADFDTTRARKEYEKVFAASSLPILKRVLFDAILAFVEMGYRHPEVSGGLANEYAVSASRLAELEIDFGIPQRNRKDAVFHRDWFNSLMNV